MDVEQQNKGPLDGLHAIAYCRVSTADKGQTVATQQRLIKEWADRYGVVIEQVFNDIGKSGDQYPRPGLSMAILELNASPTASILVSKDQSRLSRNEGQDLPKIKAVLKQGARIYYSDYGDTDPNNLGLRVTQAVKGVMNNEELTVLSDRTKKGMDTRKRAGKHIGRPAKVIITDHPETLPTGIIQKPDGSITDGCPDDKREERQRIYKGYARGTKVLSTEDVLNYARLGWTPYKVSKYLGISPASFIRLMDKDHADIYDEYRAILAQVKGASA